MQQKLIEAISKKIFLTEEDKQLCASYFEPVTSVKNTVLEMQGTIPRYLYFVSAGFMRLFYADDNGAEATTYFGTPGDFIAPFLSFINGVKAKESVACITDCEILRILKTDLAELISKSDNFKQFSLVIFEQAIGAAEKRANDLATLTAGQRYGKLMKQQPEILQHVPIQYIASFLGIKPESLSRIRRQMIS
jgi:CRP/FNR family transcriptional regulator, anaerobic regulatory protein